MSEDFTYDPTAFLEVSDVLGNMQYKLIKYIVN